MKIVEVKNLDKFYYSPAGFKIKILSNITFGVEEWETLTLLAPKGTGKSTLLKILANLDYLSGGKVKISTNFVYLPSLPSSFPWLTPFENVKFVNKKLKKKEIFNLLKVVGLEGYENHYPVSKSYGFRFRITLARSLALKPKLLIFDEPFNLMRSDIKMEIYDLLKNIKKNMGLTYLFTSSNINEALYLSDRIILLKKNPAEIIDEIECSEINIKEDKFILDSKANEIRLKIEKSLLKENNEEFLNISL